MTNTLSIFLIFDKSKSAKNGKLCPNKKKLKTRGIRRNERKGNAERIIITF